MNALPSYLAELNYVFIEFRSHSAFAFSLALSFTFAFIFANVIIKIVAVLQGMEFL